MGVGGNCVLTDYDFIQITGDGAFTESAPAKIYVVAGTTNSISGKETQTKAYGIYCDGFVAVESDAENPGSLSISSSNSFSELACGLYAATGFSLTGANLTVESSYAAKSGTDIPTSIALYSPEVTVNTGNLTVNAGSTDSKHESQSIAGVYTNNLTVGVATEIAYNDKVSITANARGATEASIGVYVKNTLTAYGCTINTKGGTTRTTDTTEGVSAGLKVDGRAELLAGEITATGSSALGNQGSSYGVYIAKFRDASDNLTFSSIVIASSANAAGTSCISAGIFIANETGTLNFKIGTLKGYSGQSEGGVYSNAGIFRSNANSANAVLTFADKILIEASADKTGGNTTYGPAIYAPVTTQTAQGIVITKALFNQTNIQN